MQTSAIILCGCLAAIFAPSLAMEGDTSIISWQQLKSCTGSLLQKLHNKCKGNMPPAIDKALAKCAQQMIVQNLDVVGQCISSKGGISLTDETLCDVEPSGEFYARTFFRRRRENELHNDMQVLAQQFGAYGQCFLRHAAEANKQEQQQCWAGCPANGLQRVYTRCAASNDVIKQLVQTAMPAYTACSTAAFVAATTGQ